MKEVAKGVHLYKGKLDSPSFDSVVGVHLRYNQFAGLQIRNKFNVFSGKGNYFSNLREFFSSAGNRNIFLFDQVGAHGGVPISNAKWVSEMRANCDGIYIIPTYEDNSVPHSNLKLADVLPGETWKEPLELINDFSEKVDAVGGYVYHGETAGCLGNFLTESKAGGLDVNVVSKCCFTS